MANEHIKSEKSVPQHHGLFSKKHWMAFSLAFLVAIGSPILCNALHYWEGKTGTTDLGIVGVLLSVLGLMALACHLFLLIVNTPPIKRVLAAVGVTATYLIFAVFCFSTLYQAGAVMFMHGFQNAVTQHMLPEDLQHWAQDILVQYDNDELTLEHSPYLYYHQDKHGHVVGKIPQEIEHMWSNPPWSVEIYDDISCIGIQWYLHGLLVCRPDERPDWDPFYFEQWTPGIYFYHVEK